MEDIFKNKNMNSPSSMISAIAGYAPERIVPNNEIEQLVNLKQELLCTGSIERLFGVKERRFAADHEQVSDLAVAAANKIIANIDPHTIDCLLFAAASSDLIEPATANIIQSKLGLSCFAFDVKNACNSFVTAFHIANAFILSQQYKKILIVTGEKLSQAIKYELEDKEELCKRLAAYSLGDAGAAALIEPAANGCGLFSQRFLTFGKYWSLCVILGGGSMHPHDSSKNYFEGKTTEMRNVFLQNKGLIAQECLKETGWTFADIDYFFMHHVSKNTFDVVAGALGIPQERFYHVMENHGNMAAASIPFAISDAVENKKLKKGDKIMIIGLASGISMSVQLLIW
jgi:3-oxoacyl-(acyl-carrier-protein) synthase III